MSDAVKLALIQVIGTLITTVGTALGVYFIYGVKKTTKDTNERVTESAAVSLDTHRTVAAVHESTNGRLLAAEQALAAMTAERDQLLAAQRGRREGD